MPDQSDRAPLTSEAASIASSMPRLIVVGKGYAIYVKMVSSLVKTECYPAEITQNQAMHTLG
jgi:hypothetical protein